MAPAERQQPFHQGHHHHTGRSLGFHLLFLQRHLALLLHLMLLAGPRPHEDIHITGFGVPAGRPREGIGTGDSSETGSCPFFYLSMWVQGFSLQTSSHQKFPQGGHPPPMVHRFPTWDLTKVPLPRVRLSPCGRWGCASSPTRSHSWSP